MPRQNGIAAPRLRIGIEKMFSNRKILDKPESPMHRVGGSTRSRGRPLKVRLQRFGVWGDTELYKSSFGGRSFVPKPMRDSLHRLKWPGMRGRIGHPGNSRPVFHGVSKLWARVRWANARLVDFRAGFFPGPWGRIATTTMGRSAFLPNVAPFNNLSQVIKFSRYQPHNMRTAL